MHAFNENSRVLFVLKYRQLYSDVTYEDEVYPYTYFSSGLLNSAKQVNEMLLDHGVQSKLVQVVDNNQIDREVSYYNQLDDGTYEKATDVIIEALWVVPEKFDVLVKLHPNVNWIIRLHSETPFMSTEGMSMEWIWKYINHKNVYLAVNSRRMLEDLKSVISGVKEYKLMYLPNYYSYEKNQEDVEVSNPDPNTVNIACFGSVRVLKNQMLQAMAAVRYARETGQKLVFHMNGSRIEGGAHSNNVLKNIRALFAGLDQNRFKLVEHGWLEPKAFRQLVATMDMSMQVSYSETFNICSSDAAAQDVPLVVSNEVMWASCISKVADVNDITKITERMHFVMSMGKIGTYLNKRGLRESNKKAVKVWLEYFKYSD